MTAKLQLGDLAHNRRVAYLREQGRLGEQSTTVDGEVHAAHVFSSLSLWQLPYNERLSMVSKVENTQAKALWTLIIVDLNTPYAKSKERIQQYANVAATILSQQDTHAIMAILMNYCPRSESGKGLQDDADFLPEKFNALGLDVGRQFVMISDPPSGAVRTQPQISGRHLAVSQCFASSRKPISS